MKKRRLKCVLFFLVCNFLLISSKTFSSTDDCEQIVKFHVEGRRKFVEASEKLVSVVREKNQDFKFERHNSDFNKLSDELLNKAFENYDRAFSLFSEILFHEAFEKCVTLDLGRRLAAFYSKTIIYRTKILLVLVRKIINSEEQIDRLKAAEKSVDDFFEEVSIDIPKDFDNYTTEHFNNFLEKVRGLDAIEIIKDIVGQHKDEEGKFKITPDQEDSEAFEEVKEKAAEFLEGLGSIKKKKCKSRYF